MFWDLKNSGIKMPQMRIMCRYRSILQDLYCLDRQRIVRFVVDLMKQEVLADETIAVFDGVDQSPAGTTAQQGGKGFEKMKILDAVGAYLENDFTGEDDIACFADLPGKFKVGLRIADVSFSKFDIEDDQPRTGLMKIFHQSGIVGGGKGIFARQAFNRLVVDRHHNNR